MRVLTVETDKKLDRKEIRFLKINNSVDRKKTVRWFGRIKWKESNAQDCMLY